MKWFLDLTTRTKLFLGFGLMVVLLALIVGTAYTSIATMRSSLETLSRIDFTNVRDLKDIRANQNGIRAEALEMLLHPRGAAFEDSHREIKERHKENSETLPKLLERNRNIPPILAKLNEFIALQKESAETRDGKVIPLLYESKVEEAKQLLLGVQDQQNKRMRVIVDQLTSEVGGRAQAAVAQAEEGAAQAIRIFLIIGMAAIVIAVVAVGGLGRAIANPLKQVSGAAQRVASGDLTIVLPLDNRMDEVGVLSHTFRTMLDNLRASTRELQDGVNVLGTSAAEILAATTQVASGAAETATAVTETTTTVEELKQTVQVASQKARYVSESAQRSVQVSQTGRKAVEETVEGMGRIREQMESIAGSIVRLSEQSQAIGEIIATVNDLAEQSNLLAVNAAIEAAKAGEHGRGFGVVAQEVKSLAEQSKQATAQVRAILNDIQRATSAAVMATEQGTKAVAAGAKQSTEAGESIRLLGESIAEAAQAATQIAASSQQQSAGIEQVALAMENIKQASAQNVASTKQSEAAAQDLNQLGQRLKQMAEKL